MLLARDQELAAAHADADPDLTAREDELIKLSNRANDLIGAGRWSKGEKVCHELLEKFPEETDGDERLSDLFKQQGDFARAKTHAEAALRKAEARPEEFDPELLSELREEIDYLDECARAGRLVD